LEDAAAEDGHPVGNLIRRICAEWLAHQDAMKVARGGEVEAVRAGTDGTTGTPL
jgi:hypothetical protein